MSNISLLELDNSQVGSFERNLPKYIDLISWIRFYPDLFLDLIKPETGGITIHPDQRIFFKKRSKIFFFYMGVSQRLTKKKKRKEFFMSIITMKNFLNKYTEAKAYWLGFLYADGYIEPIYRKTKIKAMYWTYSTS